MAIEKSLLGKAIRQVRKLHGISQAELAERAGVQANFVALVERGERGVSLETLNALADALEVPAACLAMLGTSKIAGNGTALVKSMQKLILATMSARRELSAKVNHPKKKRIAKKKQPA